MRYNIISLPPAIERKLSDADRKTLGLVSRHPHPASLGSTAEERELHNQIIEYCKRNRLLAFHGSMAHRTFRTAGEPDFIILCPGGRLLLVECKSKHGKLRPEQVGVCMWAEKLGHKIHVVRSYSDFLLLNNEPHHTHD